MFAIVQVGAAQFKVSKGDTIDAHRMADEEGKMVQLDQVLLVADGDNVKVGQPYVEGAKISAKVLKHHLAPRVIAFKYRRRKDSAVKKGSRQHLTRLEITDISA